MLMGATWREFGKRILISAFIGTVNIPPLARGQTSIIARHGHGLQSKVKFIGNQSSRDKWNQKSKFSILVYNFEVRIPLGRSQEASLKSLDLNCSFRIEYDHETNSAPVLFTIDGNKHVGGHGFVCMDTEDDVLLECTGPWVASEPYWRGDELESWQVLLLTPNPEDPEQYIRNGFASIDDTTLGL